MTQGVVGGRSKTRRANLVKKLVLLLGVLLCLQGCIIAPLIDSFKETGISESDRQRLLERQVKEFHQALFWGKPSLALDIAEEESRDELRRFMRDTKRKERIIESQIEYLDFDDGSTEADVDVAVKYYRIPYYVVNERIERQHWRFSYASGWKFVSRAVVEEVDPSLS
ncbi:MAG: hypothetical protein KDD64_10610 [Bdellovibrionales bacterium]|nr:hypothetical protein [Bdellovibrionales bacterium]